MVKKTVQWLTQLYKVFMKWSCKVKVTEEIESTLEVWNHIKQAIILMIDSTENEGVKTQCIKFMETVVIIQTSRDEWSSPSEDEVKFDESTLFESSQLKEDGKQFFEQLLIILRTGHISSVNLMACLQSLVLIARERSTLFMSKVITALEALHVNLPPTLSESQVSSVRKQLKVQLLILLKHPLAATTSNFQTSIIELLLGLGGSQLDITKSFQDVKKRFKINVEQVSLEPKKIKLDPDVPRKLSKKEEEVAFTTPKLSKSDAMSVIEATAADLIPGLQNSLNVTDLVLVSLLTLPETMPANFHAAYTPVSGAGGDSQIQHLARLMAAQMTEEGVGKGIAEIVEKVATRSEPMKEEQQQKVATIIGRKIVQEIKKDDQQKTNSQTKVKLIPTGTAATSVKVKHMKWDEMVAPIDRETNRRMVMAAVDRILKKEEKRMTMSPEQLEARCELLAYISSLFQTELYVCEAVIDFSLADIRNRHQVLFSLLYNQYLTCKRGTGDMSIYEACLMIILQGIVDKVEFKIRDENLSRVYVEAPLLTESALNYLYLFILNEAKGESLIAALMILEELIVGRINVRPQLLEYLRNLCLQASDPDVKSKSIVTLRRLDKKHGIRVPTRKPAAVVSSDLLPASSNV